jgi:hydroxyethylthiazole kinase
VRVIGPDALTPANVPHWRRIQHPGGTGWVNLNAANVTQFSDADFPHWKGWSLVDDSADQDSRCDSATVKGWLDVNGDGKVAPAEALARMGMDTVAPKLVRAICKFPTEWNAASFDQRLGWIKTSTVENSNPVDAAHFERHARACGCAGVLARQHRAKVTGPWPISAGCKPAGLRAPASPGCTACPT